MQTSVRGNFQDAVYILMNYSSNYITESKEVEMILEDVNSPITRKYQEKLFQSVLDKGHINFGDIPKSNGNIKSYSGYPNMINTLDTIEKLAIEENAKSVLEYVVIIKEAIKNIEDLSSTFMKGFQTKTDYVALEYDMYTYLCVEATTALIYSFVDFVKSPDKQVLEIKIKNTKFRGDEFFFDSLKKFNRVQRTMGMDYRKMLESMCEKGKDNFIGAAEIVGIGAVITVALAIVPLTREVIYQIYHFKGKLADELEVQANFLELNKTCVENNEMFTVEKKKSILAKQEKLRNRLLKISKSLQVQSAKSIGDSKRELKDDNKKLTIDSIRDEVTNSPFEII